MKRALFILFLLIPVCGLVADTIVFSGLTGLSGKETKLDFQLLDARNNKIVEAGQNIYDFRENKTYEYLLDVDFSELDPEAEYIKKVLAPGNLVISEIALERTFYAYTARKLGSSVSSEDGKTVVQVGEKNQNFEIMSNTELLLSAYGDKVSFLKGMEIPKMSSSQRQTFLKNNQEEGLVVFDTEKLVLLISFFRDYDQKYTWKEVGAPEVGTITAWYPNFAVGGPDQGSFDADDMTLPYGWALCDGSRILDGESIFWKYDTPNLNSDGLFLRGGEKAGNFQDDSFERHNHDSGTLTGRTSSDGEHNHTLTLDGRWGNKNLDDYPKWSADDGRRGPRTATTDPDGEHSHSVSISGSTGYSGSYINSETRPINMSVVWLIRIK